RAASSRARLRRASCGSWRGARWWRCRAPATRLLATTRAASSARCGRSWRGTGSEAAACRTAPGWRIGPGMKFDLLYELQAPKPHDERSEYRCYHEALEQIELADRLGYDTVWEVEHHLLERFA